MNLSNDARHYVSIRYQLFKVDPLLGTSTTVWMVSSEKTLYAHSFFHQL